MSDQLRAQMQRSLSDSAVFRWSVLLLLSVAMATNYYFYDVLSPIQDLLQTQLGVKPLEYGAIRSFYSIPNSFFFMAMFGGMICDKLGIRRTGTLFFLSMLLGSVVTYYGTTDYFNRGGLGYGLMQSFLPSYSPALKMLCLGFLLFGLGAETSCVVISKAVVKWFKGRELALALGVNVGIARLASSATFSVGAYFSKPVFNRPVLVGLSVMVAGFLAFLIYLFIDVAHDRRIPSDPHAEAEPPFKVSDVIDLLKTPSYLYVALLCVTFYSAVFPFNQYAVDLLQGKFTLSKETAGSIMSILPLAQAVVTPLFGWVCDVKGKSASLMILGSIMLALGHLLLSLTQVHPAVPLILLGMAFSLVPAALWPSLAKIVDEKRLGTAYGLTFSIQNFGLVFTPMLIGYALEASNPNEVALKQVAEQVGAFWPVADVAEAIHYNYTNPLLMLAVFGFVGLLFAFLLKRADKTGGFGLELPNKRKGAA